MPTLGGGEVVEIGGEAGERLEGGDGGLLRVSMDVAIIRAGQMYRYDLRQVVVGDGLRPPRTPLRKAQEEAGAPAGRWMGRGLAVLGLAAGEEVTESQLRNLCGERGRHPSADRIEAEELAGGKSPKVAVRAGALGRRVDVTGFDLVFRPRLTIYFLWALGDDATRLPIEAAHEGTSARSSGCWSGSRTRSR
ncbi:relaxase domain-containing protein [Streptomyces sp. NPDC006487]|uniref:relaxase domain-containing protein n=1 Tax=Streptomyces sp. NPDC006487 TaxID=3364748 RepID=UPI0036C6A8C2